MKQFLNLTVTLVMVVMISACGGGGGGGSSLPTPINVADNGNNGGPSPTRETAPDPARNPITARLSGVANGNIGLQNIEGEARQMDSNALVPLSLGGIDIGRQDSNGNIGIRVAINRPAPVGGVVVSLNLVLDSDVKKFRVFGRGKGECDGLKCTIIIPQSEVDIYVVLIPVVEVADDEVALPLLPQPSPPIVEPPDPPADDPDTVAVTPSPNTPADDPVPVVPDIPPPTPPTRIVVETSPFDNDDNGDDNSASEYPSLRGTLTKVHIKEATNIQADFSPGTSSPNEIRAGGNNDAGNPTRAIVSVGGATEDARGTPEILYQKLEYAAIGYWIKGNFAHPGRGIVVLTENLVSQSIPQSGSAIYDVEGDAVYRVHSYVAPDADMRFYPDGVLTANFQDSRVTGELSVHGEEAADDFGSVNAMVPRANFWSTGGMRPVAAGDDFVIELSGELARNRESNAYGFTGDIRVKTATGIFNDFAASEAFPNYAPGSFDGYFHDANGYDPTLGHPAEISGRFGIFDNNLHGWMSGGFLGKLQQP